MQAGPLAITHPQAVTLKYICQATILTMMMWQARYFLLPTAEAVATEVIQAQLMAVQAAVAEVLEVSVSMLQSMMKH